MATPNNNNNRKRLPIEREFYASYLSAIQLRENFSMSFYNGHKFIVAMFKTKKDSMVPFESFSYLYSVAAQETKTKEMVVYAKWDKCKMCLTHFDYPSDDTKKKLRVPLVRHCCNDYVICYDCAISTWKNCYERYVCPNCKQGNHTEGYTEIHYNWSCVCLLPVRQGKPRAVNSPPRRVDLELRRYKEKYQKKKRELFLKRQEYDSLLRMYENMVDMSAAFSGVGVFTIGNNNNNNLDPYSTPPTERNIRDPPDWDV